MASATLIAVAPTCAETAKSDAPALLVTRAFAAGRAVRDKAELVERAADLARLSARPPKTAQVARVMLGIKDRRTNPTQTRAQA